ncbi:MAG TPA: hypothetical protein VMS22_01470 [Candidatus Eisenbacteria bacterium]|nr:hypothetical protein [Candidatus Eisenbacteria bacterium]
MIVRAVLAFAFLVAVTADAHMVTIFPSTCAVTMGLSAPAGGVVADVAAPAAGDLLRVMYDPSTSPTLSRVQVCPADPIDPANRCGAIRPRPFTAGPHTGSIAFPAFVGIQLLSSGELRRADLPMAITLDGTSDSVAMDFTSGFAMAGGTLVVGAPIDASGAFALVGVGRSAALSPPLADVDLLLTLSCTLAPVPDLDQFALAPRLSRVAGLATSHARTLTMVLEANSILPASFDTTPTTLRLGPAPAMELRLDGGLAAAGRKGFAATAFDGSRVSVMPLRRPGRLAYRIRLRGPGIADLTAAPEGSLVVESGGLIARTAVAMRPNRARTRVRVRLARSRGQG